MEIRESKKEDLEEIIEVLKASLGESDLPLSQEIWKFKHQNNPFGKSLVLLGLENGEIIGVRAFMAWRWKLGDTSYSAYRAVDTATHPDHQGKGVFKRLTLAALEIAQKNKVSFIFNTPNEQSRPGYLKMGWRPVNNVRVGVKPAISSMMGFQKPIQTYKTHYSTGTELAKLCEEWNLDLQRKGKVFTEKSPEILRWRYEENPLQDYEVYATNDIYIAGYIKRRRNIKELRISESIYLNNESLKELKKIIKFWAGKHGVQIVTYSPEVLDLGTFTLKGGYGPVLTLRELNLDNSQINSFYEITNWSNTIGDLELF